MPLSALFVRNNMSFFGGLVECRGLTVTELQGSFLSCSKSYLDSMPALVKGRYVFAARFFFEREFINLFP